MFGKQMQLLLFDLIQEVSQLKVYNARREEEAQLQHAAESKRMPRIRKAESRTRIQMFRESLHINNPSLSPEEERNKLKEVA